MFTSNYAALAQITPPLQPVSISRGKPRCKGGWRAGLATGVEGRNFDALAPSWAALKSDDAGYHAHFAEVLRRLDPHQVYAELGPDAVLLCFCPVGQFCHRRLVAEWFEHHLAIIVPELGVDRLDTPLCVTPAYEFYRDVDATYEELERRLGRPKGASR